MLQAAIFAGGVPVDIRWSLVEPGTVAPDGQLIFAMAGLAIDGGTGIVPQNTGPMFLDELYDPSSNAFLFGIFEVTATGSGNTDIVLSEGVLGIINSDQTPLPVFGGMTICNVLTGDINGDGTVNLLDVGPFIGLISNGQYQAEADINKDGCVNLLDVDPFIKVLGGG